ncbi:MAG: DNA replication protein [Chaenotheca gracillima]|nr:MAG: DNA replication protein [Chaenotheca gracillima]
MELPGASAFGQRPVPTRTTSTGSPAASARNVSAPNFQRPMSRGDDTASSSSSKLLHDLLKEKRAQSRRISGPCTAQERTGISSQRQRDGERLVQSSPFGASNQGRGVTMDGGRVDSTGVPGEAGARGMGAREMNEHISKLHKQNFDLKLDIDHWRQRMVAMEKRLKRAETLESANADLQEVNEQLLQELEKRDRAVEEAIGIICDLEARIETLQGGPADDGSGSPQLQESASSPQKAGNPPSSPPNISEDMPPSTPRSRQRSLDRKSKPKLLKTSSSRLIDLSTPQSGRARTPSFLRSEKGSYNALRSVYLASESGSKNFSSTSLGRREDAVRGSMSYENADHMPEGLDSPRLSVLSESSFLSVYGNMRRLDLNDYDVKPAADSEDLAETTKAEEREHQPNRSTTEKVQRWVDDGDDEQSTCQGSRRGDAWNSSATLAQEYQSNDGDDTNEQEAFSPRRDLEMDLWVEDASKQWHRRPHRTSHSMRVIQNMPGSGDHDVAIKGPLYTPLTDSRSPKVSRRSPRRVRSAHFEYKQGRIEDNSKGSSFMQGPIFGDGLLPPTPDTLSTVDLQRLNLTTQLDEEPSLLDGTPAPARTFPSLMPQEPSKDSRCVSSYSFANRSDSPNTLGDDPCSHRDASSVHAINSETESWDAQSDMPGVPVFAAPSPSTQRLLRKKYPHSSYQHGFSGDMMFNGEGINDFGSSAVWNSERHSKSGLSRVEVPPSSPPTLASPSTDTETQSRFDSEARSSVSTPRSGSRLRTIEVSENSALDVAQTLQTPGSFMPESSTPVASPIPSPSKRASLRSRILGQRNSLHQSSFSRSRQPSDQKPPWGSGNNKSRPEAQSQAPASPANPTINSFQKENHPTGMRPRPSPNPHYVLRPGSSGGPRRPSSVTGHQLSAEKCSPKETKQGSGSRRWGLGRSSSVKGRT